MKSFVAAGARDGLDFKPALDRLVRQGCFMHHPIHPRLPVMAEIARGLLDKNGITPDLRYPENFLVDRMFRSIVWPIHPEIGERLGLPGEYVFQFGKLYPDKRLSLEQFVIWSFDRYKVTTPDKIECKRFASPQFQRLAEFFDKPPRASRVMNPYKELPDTSFWRRSVANVQPRDVDPVVAPQFTITTSDRVATAGSCFAQHIAKRLAAGGYNYFVTERGEARPENQRAAANYGVFSASYGNLYTAPTNPIV